MAPGETIEVEKLDTAEGGKVELDHVLLVADGDKIEMGSPTVDGGKVIATAAGNGRARKIVVFKYKNKIRYRKKTGHRQHYTALTIEKIVTAASAVSEAKAPKAEAPKAKVPESKTPKAKAAKAAPAKRIRKKKTEVSQDGS